MLEEKIIEIKNKNTSFNWAEIHSEIIKELDLKNHLIKVNLIKTTEHTIHFNTVSLNEKGFIDNPFSNEGLFNSIEKKEPSITCLIIPTGTGARFGGYAGDGNPIAKALSLNSKHLLTHPNVLNGSVLSDIPTNSIYLEGFLLDHFLLRKINIKPNLDNKIGVVFDKSITKERLNYEINVLNALQAFYGCDIIGFNITKKPLSIFPSINNYGFSSGKITNLETLIESAIELKNSGATAIALCCKIPDINLNENYILGRGIDPIGGIESIISHSISAITGLPSAHAPVLCDSEKNIDYKNISPESASEYIAQSFLPSVISGLRYSPLIKKNTEDFSSNDLLDFNSLDKIILPYNGFGSAGVLSFLSSDHLKEKIYLVKENSTYLNVDYKHLNVTPQIIENYLNLVDLNLLKENGLSEKVFKRPQEKVTQISPLCLASGKEYKP